MSEVTRADSWVAWEGLARPGALRELVVELAPPATKRLAAPAQESALARTLGNFRSAAVSPMAEPPAAGPTLQREFGAADRLGPEAPDRWPSRPA